jgi:hypothetical protein
MVSTLKNYLNFFNQRAVLWLNDINLQKKLNPSDLDVAILFNPGKLHLNFFR